MKMSMNMEKNVEKVDKIITDFINGIATLPQQVCSMLTLVSIR